MTKITEDNKAILKNNLNNPNELLNSLIYFIVKFPQKEIKSKSRIIFQTKSSRIDSENNFFRQHKSIVCMLGMF